MDKFLDNLAKVILWTFGSVLTIILLGLIAMITYQTYGIFLILLVIALSVTWATKRIEDKKSIDTTDNSF